MNEPDQIIEIEDGTVRYSIKLTNADTDHIQKYIFKTKNAYEKDMLADMAGRLNEDDLVIDVGANIGNHTLYLAAHGAKVEAFEANPALSAALQSSIALNNFTDRVTVHPLGVGATATRAHFGVQIPENLGAQSLCLGEGDIKVVALDEISIKPRVCAIKIDVEGMELEVLRGAAELILRDRPIIYVESIDVAAFNMVSAWMEQRGYVPWEMFNATPTHLYLPIETVSADRHLTRLHVRQVREDYGRIRQIRRLRHRLDAVATRDKEYKHERECFAEDRKALQEVKADLEHRTAALEKEIQTHEKTIETLKAQISEQATIISTFKDKVTTRDKDLETLRARENNMKLWSLVSDDGSSKTDLAFARLVECLTQLPAYRRLTLGPVDVARLCTEVAKSEFSDNQFATLVLASLAQALDPKPWRDKWFAFSLHKAGFKHSAARRLKRLEGKVHFSPSEERVITQLNALNLGSEKYAKNRTNSIVATHFTRTSPADTPLRVACIMDAFTRRAFTPEWSLQDLTPDAWEAELDEFKPDIVFIESAWEGKDGAWKTEISGAKQRFRSLVDNCRARGLPVVFWNKEDPVHFTNFLEAARLADFVFTTDIDCIPRYCDALGHDRIFLLPFALQPKFDTPISTIGREPGFCFAGSYYLRYPERQRDFNNLFNALKKIGSIIIYDRNFNRQHRDYAFPDVFAPYIKGTLAPSEISIAYKGFKYGVNMNTVKQSQTMFARRVFELIGSNTIVVSNFSRSIKMFFGELVVCSDDEKQIIRTINGIERDPLRYRKMRLMALRKVLNEHTYAHRAAFVAEKVLNISRQETMRAAGAEVAVVARVDNAGEAEEIRRAFDRQRHPFKTLHLIGKIATTDIPSDSYWHETSSECLEALRCTTTTSFLAVFDPADWYGANYLFDLVSARLFANDPVFAKAPMDKSSLEDPEYRYTEAVAARAALVRINAIGNETLIRILEDPANAVIDFAPALVLDAFSYLKDGADREDADTVSGDLSDIDTGLSLRHDIEPVAEAARRFAHPTVCKMQDIATLSPSEIRNLLGNVVRKDLTLEMVEGRLKITSKINPGRHIYLYAKRAVPRAELNLLDNSQIHMRFKAKSTLDLRTVFEFQDKDGAKISHNINKVGGAQMLSIPHHCQLVRFGLRIEGPGEMQIEGLTSGATSERPPMLFAKSRRLVVTKQYPDYDDLYRYGFLHSRIRRYRSAGFDVDVFRLSNEPKRPFREFEGVDVIAGDTQHLDDLLASGQIESVMVHFLDRRMWEVLSKHLENIPITIWAHGAEIQHWRRRSFEFEQMTDQEVARQKRLSDQRMELWHSILGDPHPNLLMVFVSKHFATSVMSDLGIQLPNKSYTIIHNPIDTDLFRYQKKQTEHRKKILSIRPFSSRKYANDLTVLSIIRLSEEKFFNDLSFLIVGDGDLFDHTLAPLRAFKNVEIRRGFMSQSEIAKLHKSYGVFLCPTRLDSQGVSRDEAMASGLVPVTNAVSAVPEFLDDTCGILVPPEDAEAMAAGIADLYHDPERFSRLSMNAAARVRHQSAAEHVIRQEIAAVDREEEGKS